MNEIKMFLIVTTAAGALAGRVLAQTPRGDVDGFILADGTQVHVPPHLSSQLAAAARIGDAVTVRGLRAAAMPMVATLAVTGDASGQKW